MKVYQLRLRVLALEPLGERILTRLTEATGMSRSAVFRRGLAALYDALLERGGLSAFDIYDQLDLGPGGYASVPSTEIRRGVRAALRRKTGR